ncbi:hypothetical protein QE152_g3815 [Popillia japonica]|uniref:Coiled-coil domain-containing protein 86 n=1 Tax=Popillia japonica TaxID=7064 RepID=A0AAW1MZH2_POPJA
MSKIKKALDHISADTIKNGFRVSGLCPFNVENVNFEKIATHKSSTSALVSVPVQDNIQTETLLMKLETKIGDQKVVEFRDLFANRRTFLEEADNHAGIVNVTDTSLNLEEIPRVQTPDNAKKICAGSEPSSCVPSTSQENNSSVQTNNLCTGILPFDVPSPFKGALLWPVQTPAAKRKRFKEKIPTVVTSAAWQEYHRKKEHEKLKKTKEKEERIALREQRKLKELMEKKNNMKNSKRLRRKKNELL